MRLSSRIWISERTVTRIAKKAITRKGEEGDHLVVGASPEADAVGGQRGRRADHERCQDHPGDDQNSGWATPAHGGNSTNGRRARKGSPLGAVYRWAKGLAGT